MLSGFFPDAACFHIPFLPSSPSKAIVSARILTQRSEVVRGLFLCVPLIESLHGMFSFQDFSLSLPLSSSLPYSLTLASPIPFRDPHLLDSLLQWLSVAASFPPLNHSLCFSSIGYRLHPFTSGLAIDKESTPDSGVRILVSILMTLDKSLP